MVSEVSIRVTGMAGSGIFTVGELISKVLMSLNYNVFYSNDFPSVIQGGHNIATVFASSKDVNCERDLCDVLVCMHDGFIEEDLKFLKKGGIVIVDESCNFELSEFKVFKIKSDRKFKNMSFFSALCQVFDVSSDCVEKIVTNKFIKKEQSVVDSNLKLISDVWNDENEIKFILDKLKQVEDKKIFIDGNSALALGAIKAGVGFVGEYPITPSTSILHYLMKKKGEFNIVVRQTEDEIASVMSIIGASTVGVRAMTATSGAGLSLMCEGIGMACISETGIVVYDVQRAGTSTGLPTYTGQADLDLAMNISHGDSQCVVLAPGDIKESFYLSFEAFNIADKYQVPVIVLTDKFLASAKKSVCEFDCSNLKIDRGKLVLNDDDLSENYERYELLEDGISVRSVPSLSRGKCVVSSYEHDESGFSNEDSLNTSKMVDKRFSKLDLLSKLDFCMPNFYGSLDAKLTIVCWGSIKRVCLDVMNSIGDDVNVVHFNVLNPLSERVETFLTQFDNLMLIEGNKSGQLKKVLKSQFDVYFCCEFLKYDGRSFKFEEVLERVCDVLGSLKDE